ncbi:MAG: hypothetical protein JKY32_14995 [Rhizobiales bacterium]|nr:hypothetical protein [Hyphomicrobiales bacterium]
MKNVLIGASAAALLVFAPMTSAKAEMSDLEVIFIEADKDGDRTLNKGEVLLVAITQFNLTDSDRDNMLEMQEVGELASDPEFSDNDANKDGALSIEEVITEKLADFDAADTNSDGMLSFEEVKNSYEIE